jgi:hypothetical protein
MVMLAGIVLSVDFQDGSILRGLSTALVPVKKCKDGKGRPAIQWHLVVSNSPDPTKTDEDFATQLRNLANKFLKVDDASTLLSQMAYLGWCEHASILLGTKEADYDRVNWSREEQVNMRSQHIGNSVTSGTGGLGFVTALGTVNHGMAKNQRTRYITSARQPLQAELFLASKRPCLVYDSSTQRAWLILLTCLLVHMLHLRLRVLGKGIELAPFSGIADDAGSEAYKTLLSCRSATQLKTALEEKDWKAVIIRFCVALTKLEEDARDAKDQEGESLICAYELFNIVEANHLCRFSPKKTTITLSGWDEITRGDGSLGYVLRCSGLGEVMVPRDKSCGELCQDCIRVPRGLNYLSAYIPCMAEHLQRQGKFEAYRDLDRREIDQKAIFQKCRSTCSGFEAHYVLSYEDFTAPMGRPDTDTSPTCQPAGAIVFSGQRGILPEFPPQLNTFAIKRHGRKVGRWLRTGQLCVRPNQNMDTNQHDEVVCRNQRLPTSSNQGAASILRTLSRGEKEDSSDGPAMDPSFARNHDNGIGINPSRRMMRRRTPTQQVGSPSQRSSTNRADRREQENTSQRPRTNGPVPTHQEQAPGPIDCETANKALRENFNAQEPKIRPLRKDK